MMKFSDLLNWHKEMIKKEEENYEKAERPQEDRKKLKLVLILMGAAFLIYGSIFTSRWFNSVPATNYGSSFLTGMATAPLSAKRMGEIRKIGILGVAILISGVFILGAGITMPAESFKDLFKFK